MFKTVDSVKEYCKDQNIAFIDFKIIDLSGRWHHLTITPDMFDESVMEYGIGFDGSSYGFISLEKSDMVFIPDLSTGFLDPFTREKTLVFISDIYKLDPEPVRYEGDPRYIASKLERYMKETQIADKSLLGPEFEFYLLDSVSYSTQPRNMFFKMDSISAEWNTGSQDDNLGYKVGYKKNYHADIPYDINFDLRNEMVLLLEKNGVPVKYHHPEVGGPGQVEIEVNFADCLDMGDRTMKLKYIVKNCALKNGKTVTFMPKPFYKEAGSGMHVHIMLKKGEKNLFFDKNGYSGLSKEALFAIGGILEHAPALLAITNPSTNSYKRLVPGYEAPVSICFGTANRSSVIRIPGYALSECDKRFEFRSSDATSNPYLAYSALLMAALDGIENEIDPIKKGFGPFDVNIFNLPEEKQSIIKALPKSLTEAANALCEDMDFLLKGGVFDKHQLDSLVSSLLCEDKEVNSIPNPKEFALYYDL